MSLPTAKRRGFGMWKGVSARTAAGARLSGR
jgi:hypothetical protein